MDNLAIELEAPAPIVPKDGTNTKNLSLPTADEIAIGDEKELPGNEDRSAGNKRLSSMLQKLIPTRGMLVALLAAILFSCLDVSVAISTQEVHPHLLLALYPNVIMAFSLICIIATRVKVLYNRKQYLVLVVSAGVYATGGTFLTLSISKIPVGDAVAIFNCMPIFGGVFGWILLKQSLRLLDLFFTILCISGVVLIARPSFIFPASVQNDEIDSIGVLFAIGAACFIGFGFTIGRKLQDMGINVLCIVFANAFFLFLINAVICTVMDIWSAPSPSYYWAISLAPGIFSFLAQMAVLLAVKTERAVMVTIMLTLGIVFTFIMQIFIIKIIPHWYSAIGSFCILLSCIGMSTRKVNEEEVAS
ncbi:putative solute carrier family 35 member G1 [Apostichopus japonicus]|uniref:Putative solute carrier family 35 member G1 n=1 Tax=Stichopus japonicus TaxID=307972 RepID=A0A2G8JB61_STIJA|nr:putative solute carrier family 35 member G1 [Apostichopus japonicus]